MSVWFVIRNDLGVRNRAMPLKTRPRSRRLGCPGSCPEPQTDALAGCMEDASRAEKRERERNREMLLSVSARDIGHCVISSKR